MTSWAGSGSIMQTVSDSLMSAATLVTLMTARAYC